MKQFKHHKHIFFDLDNTLWDFSGNSRRILAEMYLEFNLSAKGITDFEAFHTQYKFRNEQLWNAYRLGEISREEVRLNRFLISLRAFEVYDHGVASDMAELYLSHTKKQTELIPHTIETLEYLQTKYQLHIITNGFDEVQHFKLKNCGIEKYFKTVTTAEEARSLKPDIKIFHTAFRKMNVIAGESLYIGDTPDVDGIGAKNAGMDFILFNPEKKEYGGDSYFHIHSLKELQDFL